MESSGGSGEGHPQPLPTFRDRYTLGDRLGAGSFGAVFECVENESGEEYACKVIRKGSLTTTVAWADLKREVSIMKLLRGRHPGVVQLKEVRQDARRVRILMERCRGGDLFELLRGHGKLPEPAARFVFKQLASALNYCHYLGVVHRDIKPENILFDQCALSLYEMRTASDAPSRVQAKLADFGLSTVLMPGAKLTGLVGSKHYTAPEMLQGKAYGRRADVWSLGVMLCAMLTGNLPFAGRTGDDEEGLCQSIMRGHVNLKKSWWAGVSEEAKDLVRRMLQVDVEKRVNTYEVLSHPWVLGNYQSESSEAPPMVMLPAPAQVCCT